MWVMGKPKVSLILLGVGGQSLMWTLDKLGVSVPPLAVWIVGIFSIIFILLGLLFLLKENGKDIASYIVNYWKITALIIYFISVPLIMGWMIQQSQTAVTKLTPLEHLFHSDFNHLLRSWVPHKSIMSNTEVVNFKSSVLSDFQGNNKFVSYYIPKTPYTYQICEKLAQNDVAFQGTDWVEVESSDIGLSPTAKSELKFSGRVFIYHESILLAKQKRELYNLFKKRDMAVEFRGIDYVNEIKDKRRANNVQREISVTRRSP